MNPFYTIAGISAGIFVGLMAGIGIAEMPGSVPYSAAYREGQIDYASGKIKWVLERQPDGSTTWVLPRTNITNQSGVLDSLHVTNCYHGYIITVTGEQLRDNTGRGMPCN